MWSASSADGWFALPRCGYRTPMPTRTQRSEVLDPERETETPLEPEPLPDDEPFTAPEPATFPEEPDLTPPG
jgi:hypothetical protein